MTTLFILNRASETELRNCLPLVRAEDALLCIEDAVYLLAPLARESGLERELVQTLGDCSCFALRDDLVARGISARIPPQVTQIDYPEFVALTLRYARIVNW
jgi:sulfur relay protein TusB/DsrH